MTLDRRKIIAGLMALSWATTFAGTLACAQESKPWTYEGSEGPDKWSELDTANQACSAGLEQSPIDLKKYNLAALEPISFDWKPQAFPIVNTGRSVYANVAKGSTTKLGEEEFALKQIVFHLPSEHTIDGVRQAMEMQFVHTLGPKRLLMVSVLVHAGEKNEAFFAMMAKAPSKMGTQPLQVPIDPTSLLPKTHSVFRYRGSLTMPPCTENVDWVVFAEPVEVAQSDIDAFKQVFTMNARPVQPLNRRFLLKGVF